MEILAKDKEKRQELQTGTQHACHLLNNVIIPIAKDLNFDIDIHDTLILDEYLRDINRLRNDYLEQMKEGVNNPALGIVLEKTAEGLWTSAYNAHPIKNPYIIDSIPAGVLNYVTITGSGIEDFHARQNNPAIEKECLIEATQEDIDKRDEIKAICEALNRCFNGMGGLFSGYIAIQNGQFSPIRDVTNYKPLIHGGY